MAEKKQFKFDEWWESPKTKRVVGAVYSLGASVVIIGAMFKILHLPGAGITLGLGMVTEAILFAIGIFDKPHVEYQWQNIFPALLEKEAKPLQLNAVAGGKSSNDTFGSEDVKKMADGLKNLSETANQLASLSGVVASTDELSANLKAASDAAAGYVASQANLNVATKGLENSYQSISADMETVVKSTKNYGEKMESVNAHLASINSVYELQLRNIQAQSEAIGEQSEKFGMVANHMNNICNEMGKMQNAATVAAEEADKYKTAATKLSQQVAELNKVYGNMLNALS
ncbi:MAG: gliding motility protein GldL [Paludibacteraceae bacterium]|nr:gliding motility protein GldL [Paludibacteraceae bacterium]